MSIQWFPGHMHAARKKAAKTMEKVDLVLEIVDSRLPLASSNPLIEELRLICQKPMIKVLNKSDLADSLATSEWVSFFKKQKKIDVMVISCKEYFQIDKMFKICKDLIPFRGTSIKPLRVMIMGVPNVGKSSLLNLLNKKKIAKVGNEPAITKNQQKQIIRDKFIFIDTPGLLWPKIDSDLVGLMLAASNSVGVNAYDHEEVALFLANQFIMYYPKYLNERYSVNVENFDSVSLLEYIGIKRSLIIRGGKVDFLKASKTLIQDYRSGILGRISLETPSRLDDLAK
tara:strand:- start:431 stop:1285 length:855 start_codon:yes stop_codon:yes gene_type:complete